MEGANPLRPTGVVLHVDDQSLVQVEDLRPFVSPAGPLGPREHDSHSLVTLLEPIDSQVVIALPVSPLDL